MGSIEINNEMVNYKISFLVNRGWICSLEYYNMYWYKIGVSRTPKEAIIYKQNNNKEPDTEWFIQFQLEEAYIRQLESEL